MNMRKFADSLITSGIEYGEAAANLPEPHRQAAHGLAALLCDALGCAIYAGLEIDPESDPRLKRRPEGPSPPTPGEFGHQQPDRKPAPSLPSRDDVRQAIIFTLEQDYDRGPSVIGPHAGIKFAEAVVRRITWPDDEANDHSPVRDDWDGVEP